MTLSNKSIRLSDSFGGQALSISSGLLPAEGPRIVTASYSWEGSNNSYHDSMLTLTQRGEVTTIQSVFIDNTLCSFPVVLKVHHTGQTIPVSGNSCAVFPVFADPPFDYTLRGVSSDGAGLFPSNGNDTITKLSWLNVPVTVGQWTAIGGGGSIAVPLTSPNVSDGNFIGLFNQYPTTALIVLKSIELNLFFTTLPTNPGNLLVTISDDGVPIYSRFVAFAAQDASIKTISVPLSYIQRKPGSVIGVKVTGYPVGAANLTLSSNTTLTLYPVS